MPRPVKRVAKHGAGARHVLMTADAIGGVWTYALDLAHGLADAGMRTTLAVLGPPPDQVQRDAACRVPQLDLIFAGEPLDWMAASARETDCTAQHLAEIARRVRAEVVHLMSPLLAAHDRFRAPVVVTCHSCVATWWRAVRGAEPVPEAFRWQRALVRKGLANANAVTVPTRAFGAALEATYGPIARLHVIPNGRRHVEASGLSCTPLDVPATFALAAGRLWDKGKGIATLETAAALLQLPVIAAGPTHGPNGDVQPLRAVASIGPRSNEELAGLLSLKPIFVSPALYEPFGLAVLEAAQAACPLVLSDIDTFRELWDGAARFVPPRDATALALAIADLAGDAGLRRTLGLAARRRAAAFSANLMARRMVALLREAADARRPTRTTVPTSMERAPA